MVYSTLTTSSTEVTPMLTQQHQQLIYLLESGSEEDRVVGRIEVNSLNDLVPVYGYEIKPDPGVNMEGERYELKLGTDSKVFELVNLNEIGRVLGKKSLFLIFFI
jgi:hypothetical protein